MVVGGCDTGGRGKWHNRWLRTTVTQVVMSDGNANGCVVREWSLPCQILTQVVVVVTSGTVPQKAIAVPACSDDALYKAKTVHIGLGRY